jgi:peptide chain release factor subunit 1
MLIQKQQIESILHYRFNGIPVSSFYLNVDQARYPRGEYLINAKSLIRECRERLEGEKLSREDYRSVTEDLEKITPAVESLKGHGFKGFALFSSTKNGFFQTFGLDAPVTERLVVDRTPYTKPLLSVLRLTCRDLAVLLKKGKLRAFEVFGGRIREELDLFKASLFTTRANAYMLTKERKIQNRNETEHHKFLQEASAEVLDLFTRTGADFVVLGGDKNVARDFARCMHPYLRDRYAGELECGFEAHEKEVLREVGRINTAKALEKDRALAYRIREELSRGGHACCGLAGVLDSLSMGAVGALAVKEGYSVPGYTDLRTGMLYPEASVTPEDAKRLSPVKDVVDEAAEYAMQNGAEVRIIRTDELMEGLDGIAALLRFRVERPE